MGSMRIPYCLLGSMPMAELNPLPACPCLKVFDITRTEALRDRRELARAITGSRLASLEGAVRHLQHY